MISVSVSLSTYLLFIVLVHRNVYTSHGSHKHIAIYKYVYHTGCLLISCLFWASVRWLGLLDQTCLADGRPRYLCCGHRSPSKRQWVSWRVLSCSSIRESTINAIGNTIYKYKSLTYTGKSFHVNKYEGVAWIPI